MRRWGRGRGDNGKRRLTLGAQLYGDAATLGDSPRVRVEQRSRGSWRRASGLAAIRVGHGETPVRGSCTPTFLTFWQRSDKVRDAKHASPLYADARVASMGRAVDKDVESPLHLIMFRYPRDAAGTHFVKGIRGASI